ncbi:MAG TPA: stalk domain-containing protein [Fimbriimonadaceae bacterium]|nr:stalk domain-containing protein [Fimbriimonadaceae bacterium]
MKTVACFALALATNLVLAQEEAVVIHQGREMRFSNEARPFYRNGVPFVGARETARTLGIRLDTERDGYRIILERDRNRLVYDQGRRDYTINDRNRSMREPSQTRSGVLFLPLEMFTHFTSDLRAERARGWQGGDNTINPGRPASREPVLYYRRDRLDFSGRERPYVRRNVTFVPLRATADRTRVRVERSRDGQQLTLIYDGRRLDYRQGDRHFTIGRSRHGMDAPGEEVDGVLFVPSRMFEQLIGPEFGIDRPNTIPSRPEDRFDYLERGVWGVFAGSRLQARLPANEEPYSSGGVLMVPLHSVAQALGGRVTRSGDRFTITLGGDRAIYERGDRGYTFNGRYRGLGRESEERSGIVFVPVQMFGGFLNGEVAVRRG